MTETSIVDLMKKIIDIFNEHAGGDNKLDKEELKQLLIQVYLDDPSLFSSEEKAQEVMNDFDKNLDGSVTFEEFIMQMAKMSTQFKDDSEGNSNSN
ncbi:Oidioi.mRNA.OKI2018_I69.chr2.g5019.t1.cds [Oikopleura dioica]|uniref:Oidioi.mRNA.OKI2018_I69.chr2.g5019.t1.cds n=1 Tax=Oikopleura dioica TaxID=34765 RepID=A0ABN7SZ42_OIKDI|nr:Oidioi.mRNA.OKI2018_I69.chr2.g5019.t1.cds [Oikopleura dioica]